MGTKLIILGNPRTGSTLLQKGLSLHHDGVVYGELFHTSLYERAINHYVDSGACGRTYYPGGNCDAIEFLNHNVWNETNLGKYKFVGFKRFAESVECAGSQNFYNKIRKIDGIKYIHIYRENHLESFASLMKAEITGEWVKGNNTTTSEETEIELDEERFTSYSDTISNNDNFFSSFFAGEEYIKIEYNDLGSNFGEKMKNIFEFIGVPPIDVTPPISKQNTTPIREMIRNYDKIRKKMSGTKYYRFFQ